MSVPWSACDLDEASTQNQGKVGHGVRSERLVSCIAFSVPSTRAGPGR